MLDVEYVEAMPEPEEGVTREHDDWVLQPCPASAWFVNNWLHGFRWVLSQHGLMVLY